MSFHILYIIQFRRKRVLDIDDYDLPIGLALVQKSHDAENLDLFDLAHISNLFADFADIKRVIITLGLSLSVSLCRILPCL
jgi:hypothetical protein